MLAELEHLIQLQDLDLAAERLRRRIADVPTVQAALDERTAGLTAAVASIKERIAVSQTSRRDIEKDLAAVQGRLSKYKEQLMAVKTNKEYHAMQTEIGTAEQVVREQEDRLLDRMEEADTLAAELKTAESALKSGQTEMTRERQQLDTNRASAEAELATITAKRTAQAAGVSAPVLTLFETVSKHRKGVALSEAREGLCMQCHVRLRPQIYNTVRRNETLIQCDNCSRILYFIPPPAAASPSPAVDAPATNIEPGT